MSQFGDLVRSRRKTLGISLQDVADAIGVTAMYVSEVERGKRPPFVTERLSSLALVLKLNLTMVLTSAWSEKKMIDFDPASSSDKQIEALVTLARGGLSETQLDAILKITQAKQQKIF